MGAAGAAVVVFLPGAAAAAWSDPATATVTTTAASLTRPVLTCTQVNASRVTISWPAQTSPTTLTYSGTVGTVALPTPTISNGTASSDVTGSLLSSLLAGTKTVTVSGALPSTSWVSAAGTTTVTFVLIGLLVTC